MQRGIEHPEADTGQSTDLPPRRRDGRRRLWRRVALGALLFLELLVIGTLGGVVLLGRLPATPAGLFYALGVLVVLAVAVTFALPPEWAGRLSMHGALIAGAILFALPFIWLVGTSFKYPEETFVTPPRWMPGHRAPAATARPTSHCRRVTQDVGEKARLSVWRDAKAFLPVGQLDGLQETDVRRAVTDDLMGDLPVVSQTDGGGQTPTVRVTQERVGQAWTKAYRAFVLGMPAVRDEAGDSFNVPPEARTFAAGDGATLGDNGEGTLVTYDLSGRDQFSVTLTVDEKWLDRTLAETADDAADASLAVVALPMRQDRTWHRYDVEMDTPAAATRATTACTWATTAGARSPSARRRPAPSPRRRSGATSGTWASSPSTPSRARPAGPSRARG